MPHPPTVTPDLFRGPGQLQGGAPEERAASLVQRWMPAQGRHDGRSGADDEGFTLVELMVVIVIIGLLALIVTVNVFPSLDKAKATTARSNISTIEGALDQYKLQIGSYPTTAQGLEALVKPPPDVNLGTYQPGGYIKGGKVPLDPWGRPFLYASPGQHGEADVWTLGRDGKEGGEGADADIGSWQ